MARFCSLFSGSAGNVTYVGNSHAGVLIDAGVSAKRIGIALGEAEIETESVKAVFITHEHTDHIAGMRVFATRHSLPVYTTCGTLDALESSGHINGKFSASVIPPEGVEAAGMHIKPFATSHDCRESCGYIIETQDKRRAAVCTDLGHISEEVRETLLGCDFVMLESNHDLNMLQNGPYPYYLKRRIMGDSGHLSNACCADILPELIENGATRIVLAHLSRENNFPELALQTARAGLSLRSMTEGVDYLLYAAPPIGGRIHIF